MGWNFVSYLLSRREDGAGETLAKPTKKNRQTKSSEKKKN